jgi:hypothetical protein
MVETALAPKPLFRGDMAEQGRKLVTLGVVVNGLADLESGAARGERTSETPCPFWGQGRRLRAGRRGAAVDIGARSGGTMDAATRSSVDRGLYHSV